MKILVLSAAALLFVAPIIAQEVTAQETMVLKPLNVIMIEGNYAGTFLCSSGEMGMTLSLHNVGPATPADLGQLCRSGQGPCNDKQNKLLAKNRKIIGVLNFFPTLGNPDAPAGAFKVTGTADISNKYATRLTLAPSDWLNQSEDFGASGLSARLTPKGTIYGEPTADGCSKLRLTRLRTK